MPNYNTIEQEVAVREMRRANNKGIIGVTVFVLICVLGGMWFMGCADGEPIDREKIEQEVKEALADKKIKSFKISEKGKLKIENWLWQAKVLQEQLKTIQAYIDRWYDREKYIKGIKESEMNSYIYSIETGMFTRGE